MAYSSSDTSGSGSGRSRSLKLQPTATGPMDLSEFYTNKGYVSETWWKDYFMTVMNDVVCASSVEQLEAKIPKYFDRDYVQHVDGKTIGYDEFVEHMKVVHGKIKDVSVRWKELHAYAFANDGKRETHIFSHHVVSYKDRASGAEGSAEVCGLFKCGTDLIFECNEMTTVTHGAMGADLGSATA
uniref:SnoaL-like domain-containing protein n=1 Tax=Pelagomonas calceolata TaxID=35677 RepID=A0A7S3ZW49_9STRA|mmetsp:Transcript_11576/g.34089  ORF Transcript_11576/g.34089 Transcript_11576/m.34089 type:complete len:184 (+) Transcript_11576:237-788(+)